MKARHGARIDDAIAWMKGALVFREAPIADVREELRRWYGVELLVTDRTMASRHLKADYAGESRERIVSMIATALGGTVQWRGDTAVLHATHPTHPTR